MYDVTVLVGCPASGKSTLALQHENVICMDQLFEWFNDADSMFWATLYGYLVERRPVCIDRTCLDPHTRLRILSFSRAHGATVQAVMPDASWAEIIRRDSARACPLPHATLRRCYIKHRLARAALLDEGYDAVTYVNPA